MYNQFFTIKPWISEKNGGSKVVHLINKKIEYHFIKNIEKGRRLAILKSINKNNTLKSILLDIIIEFFNVLNKEKI